MWQIECQNVRQIERQKECQKKITWSGSLEVKEFLPSTRASFFACPSFQGLKQTRVRPLTIVVVAVVVVPEAVAVAVAEYIVAVAGGMSFHPDLLTSHLISSNFILSRLTSSRLIASHFISLHLIWSRLISSRLIWYQLFSFCLAFRKSRYKTFYNHCVAKNNRRSGQTHFKSRPRSHYTAFCNTDISPTAQQHGTTSTKIIPTPLKTSPAKMRCEQVRMKWDQMRFSQIKCDALRGDEIRRDEVRSDEIKWDLENPRWDHVVMQCHATSRPTTASYRHMFLRFSCPIGLYFRNFRPGLVRRVLLVVKVVVVVVAAAAVVGCRTVPIRKVKGDVTL